MLRRSKKLSKTCFLFLICVDKGFLVIIDNIYTCVPLLFKIGTIIVQDQVRTKTILNLKQKPTGI